MIIFLLFLIIPHWKPNSEIKVYFMPNFTAEQKSVAIRGMNSWLPTSRVTFTLAGDTTAIEHCSSCLTILRQPSPVKNTRAAFEPRYFVETGEIDHAWIYLDAVQDLRAIESYSAHETGHGLGLKHCKCKDSIMSEYRSVSIMGVKVDSGVKYLAPTEKDLINLRRLRG